MSRTNVALLLDNSGSMEVIATKAVDAANSIIASLPHNGEVFLTVITFGHQVRVIRLLSPVCQINPIRHGFDYTANESATAIFDGLERAKNELDGKLRIWDAGDANLVICITDGQNNAGQLTAARAPQTIKALQDTGKWTIAFQLPQGKADAFARKYGVPRENCEEWETGTERGIKEVEEKTCAATTEYFDERSKGSLRSVSFFKRVTTNLAGLDLDKLRSELPDLRDQFKALPIGAEQDIRDFVKAKTGRDLVIGSAYYQLTKEEKVQGDKRILIADKNSKAVFGGNGARQLIGLPTDGTPSKVTPGNHADFDIFVQSKSVNRRLVRGTKLLIDLSHTVGSVPTWDHTAGRV